MPASRARRTSCCWTIPNSESNLWRRRTRPSKKSISDDVSRALHAGDVLSEARCEHLVPATTCRHREGYMHPGSTSRESLSDSSTPTALTARRGQGGRGFQLESLWATYIDSVPNSRARVTQLSRRRGTMMGTPIPRSRWKTRW